LYKIANPLFEADTVMFFGSVRWGQMNAYYQKLIERLSWLENRHSTLKEENIIKDKDAGIIVTGQNWNGKLVVETQKQVLKFFGFKVQDSLCWNWQYTQNSYDETQKSYKLAPLKFGETFKVDPTEYIEPKK
jgi:multimeric flavodoxin WrbA